MKVLDRNERTDAWDPGLFRQSIWTSQGRLRQRGIGVTKSDRRILNAAGSAMGDDVWIIGNGPSLNLTDLGLIQNKILIGTNGIFLNENTRPVDHFVVEDHLVAEDRASEIAGYPAENKWFGNYLKYCLGEVDEANWLNVSVDYAVNQNWPRWGSDVRRKIYVGGTVTYLCLQIAFYLQPRRIILVGIDHSYIVSDELDEAREGNTLTSFTDDVNHFHPDYFGEGKRWHTPRVDRMERAYIRAREISLKLGIPIYNATYGGRLEVFPRVDFNRFCELSYGT